MDLGKMSLFAVLKKRMDYIGNRQEVLAENIANADTPKYIAKDLKPFNFKDLMRRQAMHVSPVGTDSKHIGTEPARMREYAVDDPKPYESTINGNQVVLEEQMTKMSESQVDHELTTEVYKKNMRLFKIALGKQ
ncbi:MULTISPECIES: flagellar basal body rod protein FlgB [Terasakiella]|jgi:flagellar basal-body rod protein FlgB|uniref:Flagellar basal body rod protein FlgB n=1 Tax=Terasakiella brassicae TaxID=1634917 RepID=A0A917BRT3_9PROT|nr:flagellar basal body rod protein FlgB [Terasakiella brassicae]GGF56589.1 flagellar basal body rod protein FlgB [Terasakiella brassicae]